MEVYPRQRIPKQHTHEETQKNFGCSDLVSKKVNTDERKSVLPTTNGLPIHVHRRHIVVELWLCLLLWSACYKSLPHWCQSMSLFLVFLNVFGKCFFFFLIRSYHSNHKKNNKFRAFYRKVQSKRHNASVSSLS